EALALAGDAAVAVDPDAEGRGAAGVELGRDAGVDVGHDVEGDAEAARGRAGAHHRRLRVHADRDDLQALAAVALVERLVERELLHAGLAPGRPEEDDDGVTAEVRLDAEGLRRRAADLRREGEGRRPAAHARLRGRR